MKKVLIAVAAMLATVSMLAQGQISFNNNTAPKTPWAEDTGALLGDTYQVQLWVGASEGSMSPVGSLPAVFKMSSGAATGIFVGGIVDVPVPFGGTIFYLAKAYPVGYSTYDAALNAGKKVGISTTKSLVVVGPPSTPAVTMFDKVVVAAIPEPSIIALGALGLGLLIIRRRS